MPLRSFTAPDGAVWRAWEVTPRTVPATAERRVRDRRSPEPVLLYKGPERRTRERRRGLAGFTVLPGTLQQGWLCFESGGAKRRLAPPPAGWDTCPECDLVEHWRRAGGANVHCEGSES